MKKPAIFADRDGTLIEEVNFLSSVEDLRVYDFTARAITDLKAAGYLVIVITNQSGIARGIFDEAALHAIHAEMQAQLGGAIDAFYFCPHLPTDGCRCRKPDPGMIETASRDFDLDLARSWVIGDKKIDIETALDLEMASAMVLTGYGRKHQPLLENPPTIVAADFGEAVCKILEPRGRDRI